MGSIQTFHTGFMACLTIMIVSVIAAVIMFFLFDIRTIFAIRTGRAQQRDMEKTREKNLKTDQLGGRRKFVFGSGGLTGGGKTGRTDRHGRTGSIGKTEETFPAATESSNHPSSDETVLETAPLADPGATTYLKQQEQQPIPLPAGFVFNVTENTLVIHTDERIL